jgi:SAM-dependent methyltransferase
MDRRDSILGDLDLRRLKGLEIGAQHAPLVAKSESDVRYVDYATTEEIRAGWTKSHVVDPGSLVDVDIVWGVTPLRDTVPGPVDYIVASHVIEHVPDLVGWLAELRAALKDDGVVCLAIPDRRFTFDLFRTETALSEVIEAHLLGHRQPTIRQVFDALSRTRPNTHAEAWESDPKARLAPIPEKLQRAYETARDLVANPRYFDTHCWVFTPRAFLDVLDGLHALDLLPFRVAHFGPTSRGNLEFYVRLAPAQTADEIAASLADARRVLAAAPAPPGEPA